MKKRSFNAKVVKANVPSLFRGWKEWQPGDYVEGVYHSMYETTYNKQIQFNWRIEVKDCNFKVEKDGKLISPIGQILVLNSAGSLNKVMQESEIGWGVFVQYAGKVRNKKDPTDKQLYHNFEAVETGPLEGDAASNEDDSDL